MFLLAVGVPAGAENTSRSPSLSMSSRPDEPRSVTGHMRERGTQPDETPLSPGSQVTAGIVVRVRLGVDEALEVGEVAETAPSIGIQVERRFR